MTLMEADVQGKEGLESRVFTLLEVVLRHDIHYRKMERGVL